MDLATVDTLLTTTRSVRRRLDLTRPVEPAVIQACLDIAIQAPTGGNRQGYHFLVITDADKRKELADLYRKAFYDNWTLQRKEEVQQRDPRNLASYFSLAEHLHDVPVHIIPCIEGRLVGTELFAQASGYAAVSFPPHGRSCSLCGRVVWGQPGPRCISSMPRRLLHSSGFLTTSPKRRYCLWRTTLVMILSQQSVFQHGSGRIGMGGSRHDSF